MKKVLISGNIGQEKSKTMLIGYGYYDEKNGKLSWKDEENSIEYQFNFRMKELIKEDQNSKLHFHFQLDKETKNAYILKDHDLKMEITIFTTRLLIKKNEIEIHYKVLDNVEQEQETIFKLNFQEQE